MNWSEYLRDTPGRIGLVSFGLALLGAGLLGYLGSDYANLLLSMAPIVGAMGFIFCVGLSHIDYPGETITLIFLLPVLGGLYFVALTYLQNGYSTVGMVLMGVGAVSLLLGLFRGKAAQAS